MAVKTFYLSSTAVSPSTDGWRVISETTAGGITLTDGWVVGTGATLHSELQAGSERAATTFVDTTAPDGTLDTTLKDAFRSDLVLNGGFAAGNWTFTFAVRAVSSAGTQNGRIRFRVLVASYDGSGAVEITSGQQQASLTGAIALTGQDYTSSATISLPAFALNNQYLFIQVAWERTAAGGMSTADVNFRTGSTTPAGTRIVTTDFTPAQLVTTAGVVRLDGYSLSEAPSSVTFNLAGNSAYGQSFIGTGQALTACEFGLAASSGAAVGTCVAKLYAAAGTHGVNAIPTGTPLAVSETLNLAVIRPTSPVMTAFKFTDRPVLDVGTTYVIVVELLTLTSGSLTVSMDTTSPAHSGNRVVYSVPITSWVEGPSEDLAFTVYGCTSALFAPTISFTAPSEQAVTGSTIVSTVVVNQPRFAYRLFSPFIQANEASGLRYEYDSMAAAPIRGVSQNYRSIGQSFVYQGVTGAAIYAELSLQKDGSPTDAIYVDILSGGIEGTVLITSAVVSGSTLSNYGSTESRTLVRFELPGLSLTNGSTYYLRIWRTVPNDISAYWWWYTKSATSATTYWYNGTSWVTSAGNQHMRLMPHLTAPTVSLDLSLNTATVSSTVAIHAPSVSAAIASMSSRLNVGRLNAFRLNYAPPVTVDQDVSLPLIGGAVALPPLEGYWAFDEAVGATAGDSTGHGHSINLIAAAWDTANNIFGASAVKWDGTGARIGDFATPLSIGTVHTVACWINDWDGSTDGIIVNAQSATAAYALYLDGTNIYYSAGAGNFVSVAHGGGLAGSPHHLVVTRNGSSVTFYIDGVSKGTQTLSSGGDAIDLISIGGRFVAAFIWHGTIDDLRVYLTALTPGEVAALYALDPGAAVGGAQVFAPSTAVGPVSATLPHIAASSTIAEPLVTVDAVSITLPSIASTSTIYAPSTAAVGFVTTPTLGSTATLTAPTVTTLTQVTGAFIGSTVAVRAPGVAALSFVTTPFISSTVSLYSLQVTQNVLLAFCPSTAVLYPPSSQVGPVSITLGYIASTTVLHGMIVSTGAIAIITATFGPGSTVFPPLATTGPVTVTLPTVTSTAQARPPAVAPGAVVVTAGFLASTATLNPPAIGAGTITLTLPVITSTVQVYPPSSDVGQVGVTTAFLASTATVFPPIILIGAAVVVPGFITSTSTVFALSAAYAVTVPMVGAASSASSPSVAYAVLLPACAPTSIVFPPALAVGAATVELPLIGSTTNVYPLGAAYEVTPPAIINVSDLYAPDVAVEVVIVSIPSGVQLFPPFTGTESFATTAFIDGETVAYAPFRVQALNILQPAPPERHFMVPFEYRMFNVGFVERGFIVPFDRRMYDVGFEQREFIVPFEYRHWEEEYAVPVRHGGKGSRR